MRNTEIEIESMVGKGGKEMWSKLDEIGPKLKRKNIPEEVIIDSMIETNIDVVKEKWVSDFAGLYAGIPIEDQNFDKIFLQEVLDNKYNYTSNNPDINSLNSSITYSEVKHVMQELKNNKAVSVDLLPNEIMKNDTSTECLTALFNHCFNNSIIPEKWRKALISPVYKGKNKNVKDPKSYRPISLICNPCKMFTSILNKRLLSFLERQSLLVEEQNGFRQGRSCQDHVFVLSSIIDMKLYKKNAVYSCFVDFSSAFDFVNRNLLIHSLADIGVNGKFLDIVKSLYRNTQSAIKINSHVTQWFDTKAGVRQGQNDSTTMFAIFLNTLAEKVKSLGTGVNIDDVCIPLLLYADDIVLLAESEKDLQKLLDELFTWCHKWRMQVNNDKTKIIHFRPKFMSKTDFKFKYGETNIELVTSYRYLGVTLNEHLNKQTPGDILANGASRALGKLLSKYYLNRGLGLKTYKKVYDTCICPVMDYCAGIWGHAPNDKLDKIHMRAIRCFLGVNRYATKVGYEGELGWVPPLIRRQLEMLRLWNHLVGLNETRLPRIMYGLMMKHKNTWINEIISIFKRINCMDMFENNVKIVNFKVFLNHAKDKLMMEHCAQWLTNVNNKHIYAQFKNQYNTEKYCNLNLKRSQRSLIAKLRLGILPIRVETGRYNNTIRQERICLICNNGNIEDEYHVMFYCEVYKASRSTLLTYASHIEKDFRTFNDTQKLEFLTTNINLIRKTACFIQIILKMRQMSLNTS